MKVNGGAYDIDIRPSPGFNIVTLKVDVAFAGVRDAERLRDELERRFDADKLITISYDPVLEPQEQGE